MARQMYFCEDMVSWHFKILIKSTARVPAKGSFPGNPKLQSATDKSTGGTHLVAESPGINMHSPKVSCVFKG